MIWSEDKCPVCGGKDYTVVGVDNTNGYSSLVIHSIGRVTFNVCLGCGTVYIGSFDLERLRKKIEKKND